MNNRKSGLEGEQQAVDYLKKLGYEIVQRNFSCKLGEIDIIAKDKDYLVFVEVKSRINTKFGMPFEAVNKQKIKNIIAVAKFYLLSKKMYNWNVRFDVVSILRDEITHIPNAFSIN